jgi:hypothetical protein
MRMRTTRVSKMSMTTMDDEDNKVKEKKRERKGNKMKAEKAKKRKRNIVKRKKTSLQSLLWDEDEDGKWICKLKAICGSDGTNLKFHASNMKRHWTTKHSKNPLLQWKELMKRAVMLKLQLRHWSVRV